MTCRFARFWFSQGTLLNLLGAKETSSNVSSFSRDLTRIWFTCSFAPDRIGNGSSLDLPRSLKCFFQVARMVSGPDVVCWSTLSMFPWQHVLDVLKQFRVFYLNLQSKSCMDLFIGSTVLDFGVPEGVQRPLRQREEGHGMYSSHQSMGCFERTPCRLGMSCPLTPPSGPKDW